MLKKEMLAINLENISKIFPNGTVANQDINLKVKYGEIHALFGENGAGKSTLIKILLGELQPTSGKIKINNQTIIKNSSKITKSFNMAAVHQHFSLINNFSIFENVILGYENKDQKQLTMIAKAYDVKLKLLNETKVAHEKKLDDEFKKLAPEAKKNATTAAMKELKQSYEKQLIQLNLWKQKKSITLFCYQKGIKRGLDDIINKFNLNLDLNSIINDVSVSKKQKTEILKVLFRKAEIIIFDEPTSIISGAEIDKFLKSLLVYKKEGKAIVFISHKVNEIKKVADRITILRKGKVVGSYAACDINNEKLISLMVGEKKMLPISNIVRNPIQEQNILEIKNLSLKQGHKFLLKDINLNLRKGEIVAIAGIEENGQCELLETIARINDKFVGDIFYHNILSAAKKVPLINFSAIETKQMGISYICQDRQYEGLLINEPLYLNTFFNNWSDTSFFSYGFICKKAIFTRAEKIIKKYNVHGATSPNQLARSLSGGNQQKFIIGRELETNPRLLLINEPTWGIDIGTINHLNQLFLKIRNEGKTILFASSELELILTLSDRIFVMSRGKIIGEVNPKEKNAQEKIGKLMTINEVN